ncbi:spermine synthase [Desulfonatronovibrio hydrogenovorans]|uniref:spermine/spermidine synthase domain-containing protein n=1 Tax=Desulfonatronovibrio hydrogenovorans TaxID=53245 RepID=UPI000A9064D8|nr:spermine synthase [Desulfonatronovibrio hydrogenovorans]
MNRTVSLHILAVLMLGIVSQTAQVLILRELLMVFHGNELSMGIILCAWLSWVGAGSFLGARLTRPGSSITSLFRASTAGVVMILPLTILLIRILRGMFNIPPGAYLSVWDMFVSCFVLMGPVCLLLGAQFVILARIWREKDAAPDTSGAAKTYVVEAAGNMLGGLLFTLVMVRYFNSFQTGLIITLCMLLPALFLAGPTREKTSLTIQRAGVWAVCTFLVSVPLFFLLEKMDSLAWTVQWQHMTPQHELAGTYQSKHGNITVLKRHDQYSFFQSGHLVFSTAGPETMLPGLEQQEAVVFAHLAMVQHPEPKSVLLIGGGLRGVLAETARHPVRKIDYIELDPVLTRAVLDHAGTDILKVLQDPRITLIHTDARLYVKKARKKYDMIIIDVPDPATAVLNRYYTREFFQEARQLLNPGGVLATGLVSTPDLRTKGVAHRNAATYHTLASVFARVLPVGDRFLFYFATDTPEHISPDPDLLAKRYLERNINAQGFSALHFHVLLEDAQLRRVNWIIRNHGRNPLDHIHGPGLAPISPEPVSRQELAEKDLPPVQSRYFINSDLKPIGYFYTLMFWNELTGSGQNNILETFLKVRPWWALPLTILPLAAIWSFRLLAPRLPARLDTLAAVLFTAFTTGFSTMALQMALLFSFQSIYGFIYETVGLIMGLFMLGLALGAWTTQSLAGSRADLSTLALVQVLMAACAGAMALVLPQVAALEFPVLIFVLFSGLTFTAGFINGIDFPLTMACYQKLGPGAEKSAGAVYGTELMGACTGAVLAGAIVIPVLGVTACCLMAALAGAAAFTALKICRRPDV